MNFTLMWTQQLCTHGRVHMFCCHASHSSTSAWWLNLFHVVSTADENVCFFLSLKSSSKLSHVREKWRGRGRACSLTEAPQLPALCVKNTPPPLQTLTGHQWGRVFSNMTADSRLVYTNNHGSLLCLLYTIFIFISQYYTCCCEALCVFQP